MFVFFFQESDPPTSEAFVSTELTKWHRERSRGIAKRGVCVYGCWYPSPLLLTPKNDTKDSLWIHWIPLVSHVTRENSLCFSRKVVLVSLSSRSCYFFLLYLLLPSHKADWVEWPFILQEPRETSPPLANEESTFEVEEASLGLDWCSWQAPPAFRNTMDTMGKLSFF